jgi:hypothetical protein
MVIGRIILSFYEVMFHLGQSVRFSGMNNVLNRCPVYHYSTLFKLEFHCLISFVSFRVCDECVAHLKKYVFACRCSTIYITLQRLPDSEITVIFRHHLSVIIK